MSDQIIETEIKIITKAYNTTFNELEKELMAGLDYTKNPGFSIRSVSQLTRFIEQKMGSLRNTLENYFTKAVDKVLTNGFTQGILSQFKALGLKRTAADALKMAKGALSKEYVAKMAQAEMRDLLAATRNTENSVKQLIRKVFSKHMTIKNLQGKNQQKLIDKMVKDLQGGRLRRLIYGDTVAIVDKAGRRWNTRTYVEMATHTKLMNMRVEGIREYVRMSDGKGDLCQIPINGAKDACNQYEGMIISITGMTPGYQTYDALKATGNIFHPNCKHAPIPYYDYDSIPADIKQKHEQVVNSLESE